MQLYTKYLLTIPPKMVHNLSVGRDPQVENHRVVLCPRVPTQ